MKVVNVIGGLGNQLFQYAFAVALKTANPNEDVYIDTEHFNYLFLKKFKTSNLHNGYELDKLFHHLEIKKADRKILQKVTYYVPNFFLSRVVRKVLPKRKTEYVAKIINSQTYNQKLLTLPGNVYYEGYWQASEYFLACRDELCRVYAHPIPNEHNSKLIDEISNSNSVGIHVRRGNYLKSTTYSGICDVSYYQKALNLIKSDGIHHHFYIFSNDVEWCKQNILPILKEYPVVIVTQNTGKNSYWDMYLMTYCHKLIIANSSFSWWGAFMNKVADMIIAPYPWMNGRNTEDVYVPGWIKLKN